MSRERVDEAVLADRLTRLPDWRREDATIVRAVDLPSFRAAIALVMAVADVAEEMDHHPDIDVRYRTVTFRLSTHSAGGLTQLDLDQAERIDALARDHGG